MLNTRMPRVVLLCMLLASPLYATPSRVTAVALHRPMPIPAPRVQTVRLRRGMVITQSVRIARDTYALRGYASVDSAVITIRGNDITVDFDSAVMRGIPMSSDPDRATGVGIRIEGGRNVRIINANVHGYKIGLYATGTRDLSILAGDFGYNWKPRLYSVIEHESLADWLSHHHNENGEWLRFGAGISLVDVRGGEIKGNRIEEGMEGLMLTRSDSLLIWNNTIEYNSGVGVGLYRSSYNRIMHNRASYNVRGFSKYYRRGQDSADLLMYEQSCFNTVAYNTMTHGGDGLFLWAGQSTMDTGVGGANDNVFYANDFSYAPANAIEATFSRNTFASNNASGSDYGMWGGYSFDSVIKDNSFNDDRTGVAIEHGQGNTIRGNSFRWNKTAVNLWADSIQPSDWGYPKHRDTRSRNNVIEANSIIVANVGVRVANTTATVSKNSFGEILDTAIVQTGRSQITRTGNDTTRLKTTMDMTVVSGVDLRGPRLVPELPGGYPIAGSRLALFGGSADSAYDIRAELPRAAIIVDEWGPYSYTYPRFWPVDSTHANPLKLVVFGPEGDWRIVARHNVANLSVTSAHLSAIGTDALDVHDTITVTPATGFADNWSITAEYHGKSAIRDARGVPYAAGKPYRFTYGVYEPIPGWDVAFHVWPDSADPRTKPATFDAVLRAAPLLTRHESRLDYMWYGPPIRTIPQEKWAAVATTHVTLPAGSDYTLRSISDDGARVYVDGKLAIDDWSPHESMVGNARITPGTHDIRVVYYQIDGWSELRVEIVKGLEESSGSPGPH